MIPLDPNTVVDTIVKPSAKTDIKFNKKIRLSKHNKNKIA